jgi:hypothetical protein
MSAISSFTCFPDLAVALLTASGAVADWWHRSTSCVLRFLIVVPFCLFSVASSYFWPLYALRTHEK